jgi:hypothetical protein
MMVIHDAIATKSSSVRTPGDATPSMTKHSAYVLYETIVGAFDLHGQWWLVMV